MSNHTEVAKIILQQLGGNRFAMFTGAKNFVAHNEKLGALSLRVPMNTTKDRVAMVKITLDYNDTYTVEFFKVRKNEATLVHKSEGIYCDMLQDCFLEHTGLFTRFGQ